MFAYVQYWNMTETYWLQVILQIDCTGVKGRGEQRSHMDNNTNVLIRIQSWFIVIDAPEENVVCKRPNSNGIKLDPVPVPITV